MIIFTQHALLKLKQRGIAKSLVIEAIKLPDYKLLSYGERKITYKKFGKLYLKVIYKKENKDFIIITQYWESKPRFIK